MIGTRIYSEHKHSHSWENLSIAIYQFVLKLFETHIIRFSFQIAVAHPSKWKEKTRKQFSFAQNVFAPLKVIYVNFSIKVFQFSQRYHRFLTQLFIQSDWQINIVCEIYLDMLKMNLKTFRIILHRRRRISLHSPNIRNFHINCRTIRVCEDIKNLYILLYWHSNQFACITTVHRFRWINQLICKHDWFNATGKKFGIFWNELNK